MAKILIIEDEQDLREALKAVFEDKGYEVTAVERGEEGLRKVYELKPDLVLLDLFTHSIHGNLLLERVRADERIKDTKFIVLTNIDHEAHRKRALELGVIDYLIKAKTPLSKVVSAVESALRQA